MGAAPGCLILALAITTDAEAPIVAKSDYAVVGDLAEIVLAIVADVRARQSG